jgi:subtilisin family serine protease
LDGEGNVIDQDLSQNNTNGTHFDPYRCIEVSVANKNYAGFFIRIMYYQGWGDRFMHLNTPGGTLQYATKGAIKGHAANESAFCVNAVSANGRTTPFTGAEGLEDLNSDGPRRVFYYPDGTAITPGNFSSTGGFVRGKPSITAADGVACSAPGFNPFYGTSAAAPHAAAITALLLSARPNATRAEIRSALIKSALPSPQVWNNVAGHGIVMASKAQQLLSGGIVAIYLELLLP